MYQIDDVYFIENKIIFYFLKNYGLVSGMKNNISKFFHVFVETMNWNFSNLTEKKI